jgi:MFS family permease
MAEAVQDRPPKLSWKFPTTFWYANGAELCERAAYYGMFITLYRYLNIDIGFTDPQTGLITALFAGGIYFFPTFMGIMADKIGFKQALMLAFTLLTAGYALLGAFQLKTAAVSALTLIMLGGAIIKPVISGTVAKCSDAAHRARAMSIFYMVVNIGSFSGKGLAGYLNEALGLQYINFYAAGMSFAALLLVTLVYQNPDSEGVGKTVREALRGLCQVMGHFRFLSLILIIAGFWLIQGQLYAAMPTYIERMLGKGYKPEWLANINPLIVVIFVVLITHLIRNFRPEDGIGIGLLIIPFTALVIAFSPVLQTVTGTSIDIPTLRTHPLTFWLLAGLLLVALVALFWFLLKRGSGVPAGAVLLLYVAALLALHLTGKAPFSSTVTLGDFSLHPLILLVMIGIALQGLAECFLSPKFLEYASKQAPKGEVGLYLGYQHLTTFFAWLAGFLAAGFLLDAFCPDPRKLDPQTRHQWRLATDPKYQFSLSDAMCADLGDGVPLSDSIAQALHGHNLDVPENAMVGETGGKDWWTGDPERRWWIETPLLTVEEQWSRGKPRWALWRSPDSLLIVPDGSALAPPGTQPSSSFTLDGKLWEHLKAGESITAPVRQALVEHGIEVPGSASIRKEKPIDRERESPVWRIVIRHYSIEEAKLETDADARSAGRDRALRDVLLYAHTGRPAQETLPLPREYRNAHCIWYVFSAIGFCAFLALLVFKFVTAAIDRRRAGQLAGS